MTSAPIPGSLAAENKVGRNKSGKKDQGGHGAEQAALKGLAATPDPAIAPLGHFVLADVYAGMGRDADARRQVALGQAAEKREPQTGRR